MKRLIHLTLATDNTATIRINPDAISSIVVNDEESTWVALLNGEKFLVQEFAVDIEKMISA